MITVEIALKKVKQASELMLSSETRLLSESIGYVLSKPIYSPINMPPFAQSAMDGYAINYKNNTNAYKCIGEMAAGDHKLFDLKLGECIRIFTGALVPFSANMVIKQESAKAESDSIIFTAIPKLNANIRSKGGQIKQSEFALEKGHILTPASIGFLASLGINRIEVIRQPKIAIVSTGDELVKLGQKLELGQIYESNGTMLLATLKSALFQNINHINLPDNLDLTIKKVKILIAENDVVIFTGGISVGDYDFVGQAIEKNEINQVFYKVKQKPGKPLYFGTKNSAYIFGVPGNPAACLTCYYTYILPLLNQIMGKNFDGLRVGTAMLSDKYVKKGNRSEFLKGYLSDSEVTILEGQSSAMLKTFALANVLVYFPQEIASFHKGTFVKIYYL